MSDRACSPLDDLEALVVRMSRDVRCLATVRDAASLLRQRGAIAEAQRLIAIVLSRCGDPGVAAVRAGIAVEIRELEAEHAFDAQRARDWARRLAG